MGITPLEFFVNLLIALILIIIGIILGKLIKFGVRKILEKLKINRIIKPNFINLILVIVKWSVYILFINFALTQLRIPQLTTWLTTILAILPSLTGALIMAASGFAIGSYLKNIVAKSKIKDWQIFSQILFYFVIYIFVILAFKTALIFLKDQWVVNILLLIFTFLGGLALLIYYFKKK